MIQRIGDYELSLFTGWIDECPLKSDRKSRTIIAYDAFYQYGDVNVSEWYNTLDFPVDINDFLISLLNYVGISYAATMEVRHQFDVYKTLETVSMDFISVIKAICQVIGGFGIINADGEFDIVYFSNEISEHTLTAMSGFELEPYTVQAIDKVVVRSEKTDIGGIYGDGDNAYIIQGNFLCFGMDAEAIQTVAAGLYANVSGYSWKPCLFEMGISNPLIGCDGIRYKVVTSQGDEFETYILNSYLSGVQLFDQELESFGTDYRNEVIADDYTNNFILAYRVMKLKATVDGFDLQIENKVGEDEVITKINASAEKITISSSKIDIAGLVKFINEDNGDETLINGGKIKTDNLTSISANIGGFVFVDGNMRYLQESLYKSFEDGTSEGVDITTKWYSSGFSAIEYEQNSEEKAIWFGAHPIINGDGLDDKSYYTDDKLFYPFYITAGGKIVSRGENSTTIFGSGHNYTYNLVKFSWTDSASMVMGNESAELKAGYLLLNDLIKFSGKGFDYNETNILAFNTDGIYSPKINAENLSAKESISTTELFASDITVGGGGIYSNGDTTVLGNIKTVSVLGGSADLSIDGKAEIVGTLTVDGATTLNSTTTVKGQLIAEQGMYVYDTDIPGWGSTGYIVLARVEVKGAWLTGDQIRFKVRGHAVMGEIILTFSNTGTVTNTTVTGFAQTGNLPAVYYVFTKGTNSVTVDIILHKGTYQYFQVINWSAGGNHRSKINVTFSNTFESTLRSGAVAATAGTDHFRNIYIGDDASVIGDLNVGGHSTIAGGLTVKSDWPVLTLQRTDGPYYAGIQFNNTAGLLGGFGMNSVNGNLVRFASDLSTMYTLLDTGNYSSWVQSIITGSANATNGYLRIPGLKIQIAWLRKTASTPINTAWGSGYETAGEISLGNWAASFSAEPVVTYSASCYSTSADIGVNTYARATATSAGSVYLQRNTPQSTVYTYYIYAIAVGPYS